MKLSPIVTIQVFLAMFLSLSSGSSGQESSQNASASDSLSTALLIEHLRTNFDDIHDVSMRFHHLDHRLNGMIDITMHWENGRMTASSVVRNETNNDEFASALTASIKKWYIKDLTGPFDITLPLRIRIVGSDDSTFSQKGIFTGVVSDSSGNPVNAAELSFRSAVDSVGTLTNCYSNREGVFVKTLIPVGAWDVECRAEGFEPAMERDLVFEGGEHIRREIVLQRMRR